MSFSFFLLTSIQLALEYGIKFMETSAKANINVENVCGYCSSDLLVSLITYFISETCTLLPFALFVGIFDACQRHQIENGYKIGI